MMIQIPPIIKENKEIVAAVLGGTLAIIAAYIRRDRTKAQAKKKPRLTIWLFCILLGAGCLFAEYKFFWINPNPIDQLNTDNIEENAGELLILAGCVFLAAGLIWGFVNMIRLMSWQEPSPEVETVVPVTDPAERPFNNRAQAYARPKDRRSGE
jgi:uncharacterized membrane protein YidH (DUF202 family)